METLFIGQQRFDAATSASTNSWALEALRDGKVQEGALFTTKDQTSGRGQRGNSWESSPGKNLTMSLVLYPSWLKPGEQFCLSQVISLAVAGTLEELLPKTFSGAIRIKWPNDIFVGEKKVGGILIENSIREGLITASVAGIGLNLNQPEFATAPQAASLLQIAGKEADLEDCISRLCKQIEWRYLKLKAGKKAELKSEYLEKLFGLDEMRSFQIKEEIVYGSLRGVTEAGLLVLEFADGGQRTFDIKELKFIF